MAPLSLAGAGEVDAVGEVLATSFPFTQSRLGGVSLGTRTVGKVTPEDVTALRVLDGSLLAEAAASVLLPVVRGLYTLLVRTGLAQPVLALSELEASPDELSLSRR